MRRAAWVLFALGIAHSTATRAERRLDDEEDVSRSAAPPPAARPPPPPPPLTPPRDRFLQEVQDGVVGVTLREPRDRARDMATVDLDEVDKD